MTNPKGMLPAAFDSYILAMFHANVDPETTSEGSKRVVQTIGNAPASAGTHAKDDTLTYKGKPYDYCAAVDISVRGLTLAQIKKVLTELAKQGFVAWYRHTGSFAENRHIHAVYVAIAMKPSLQAQVRDYLQGRTGLVGHAAETFYTAPESVDAILARLFVRYNPSQKSRVPAGPL